MKHFVNSSIAILIKYFQFNGTKNELKKRNMMAFMGHEYRNVLYSTGDPKRIS